MLQALIYGLYDHRSPLRKEDFGIITTILNVFNVLSDEIRNHTSILLSKLEVRAKPNTSGDPQVKGAGYICHQQGHWAPECPDRQSIPKPTWNQCFKCGQDGHWVRDFPENLPPSPKQQPLPLPPAHKKTQKRKAKSKKEKTAKEWMCLIFSDLRNIDFFLLQNTFFVHICVRNNMVWVFEYTVCVWIKCFGGKNLLFSFYYPRIYRINTTKNPISSLYSSSFHITTYTLIPS